MLGDVIRIAYVFVRANLLPLCILGVIQLIVLGALPFRGLLKLACYHLIMLAVRFYITLLGLDSVIAIF